MNKTISVWDFHDAPEEFRRMSTHGGDEDGVALIPAAVTEPHWLERLWSAYGDEDRVLLPDGSMVIIWAHS